MYEIAKTIHVIAAIAWVGGGLFHKFASMQLDPTQPATALWWAKVGGKAGKVYYMPMAIVTLLAGIVMVLNSDSIGFGDLWITLGFTGVIASAVLGGAFIARSSEGIVAQLEGGAPDPAVLQMLGGRIKRFSTINSVILLVVVWAMVTKP